MYEFPLPEYCILSACVCCGNRMVSDPDTKHCNMCGIGLMATMYDGIIENYVMMQPLNPKSAD